MANFNPADYVDVQTRINMFWADHPNGAIVTDLMSPPDDFTQCRYQATVYQDRADDKPAATGFAFEIANQGGMANRTSHEENCETSAIGRALANMGYAKSAKDRPSREEMAKAAGAEPRPAPRTNALPNGVGNGRDHVKPGHVPPLSWTQFWDFARPHGFRTATELKAVLADWGEKERTPQQAKDDLEAFLAEATAKDLAD
jgi:hypothetical protein